MENPKNMSFQKCKNKYFSADTMESRVLNWSVLLLMMKTIKQTTSRHEPLLSTVLSKVISSEGSDFTSIQATNVMMDVTMKDYSS